MRCRQRAGIGQRLVVSGSDSSWHALGLFLIARFVGAREAMEVVRLNLFDWDATSPLAYAAMMRTGQLADPIIARCQEWAAQLAGIATLQEERAPALH